MTSRAPLLALAAALLAGTVALAQGAAPAAPGKPAAPVKGGQAPAPAAPGGIDFGNDSSQWALDGECDDRRFAGTGMASTLDWSNTGRDASDCGMLHASGAIRLWVAAEAEAATRCGAIDFGDDAGAHANDGACDDWRFEGLGSAGAVTQASTGHDASDCSRLCAFGAVALRDY